jgi:hypothetical protein
MVARRTRNGARGERGRGPSKAATRESGRTRRRDGCHEGGPAAWKPPKVVAVPFGELLREREELCYLRGKLAVFERIALSPDARTADSARVADAVRAVLVGAAEAQRVQLRTVVESLPGVLASLGKLIPGFPPVGGDGYDGPDDQRDDLGNL